MVKHVSSDGEFDRAMKAAGGSPVCVDFFAEWCGPCKQIAPFFESLSGKYPTVTFIKVDVDNCQGTSARYSVTAMPTFIMVVGGQKQDSVRGADSSALEAMVKKHAYSGGGGQTLGGRTTGDGAANNAGAPGFGGAPAGGEPGPWALANEKLTGFGVPSFSAGGFVFEPAVLVLALLGLFMYGPFALIAVVGGACLAQTSASPFDRYTPVDPRAAGAPASSGGAGGRVGGGGGAGGDARQAAARRAPTAAFGGAGRKLGD